MRRRALTLLLSLACACAPPDDRPSIVLVSWDAVRADHLSLYGYERETTPTLDALASESVVYEQAHTTQPYTLSHMSLLTGLYPSVHGVVEGKALSPELPTLAERLADAGYDTLALYHEGWIHERHGFARGFRVFRKHSSAQEAAWHLSEELEDVRRPFFLFLHLFDAHCADLDAPGGLLYAPPEPFDRMWVEDAPDRLGAHTPREFYEDVEPPTPAESEALVALYDGGIRYLDQRLGAWIDDWKARGFFDDTILVVTADHGESLGTRDRWYGHGQMYEEGLRVPLLVRWPDGHRAGERHALPVSQVDVVPTLLDAVGLDVDPWLSGYSLLSGRPPTAPVIAQRGAVTAVVQWPWKVIQGEQPWAVQVFDLERDPAEEAPLERGPELRRKVIELIRAKDEELGGRPTLDAPPLELGAMSPEEVEALRAMGYLGD